MLAPIVLFTYNRPHHTLQTLEALSKNTLARDSELFIYTDAPKDSSNAANKLAVQQVRNVIRQKKWCGKVHIIEQTTNQGLAASITQGVTYLCESYGKAIVLEDDIVASSGFLSYMNEALDLFEQENKVMHISAYMFPVKEKLPETFFYNAPSCWGWATWKRAWKHYNPDAKFLFDKIRSGQRLSEFDIEGSVGFSDQLKQNISGKINTWAVKWYGSFFLQNGLALHPRQSLTQNIGNDNSGVHGLETDYYYVPELASNIRVNKIALEESTDARQVVADFYSNMTKTPFLKRVIKTINKYLHR